MIADLSWRARPKDTLIAYCGQQLNSASFSTLREKLNNQAKKFKGVYPKLKIIETWRSWITELVDRLKNDASNMPKTPEERYNDIQAQIALREQ